MLITTIPKTMERLRAGRDWHLWDYPDLEPAGWDAFARRVQRTLDDWLGRRERPAGPAELDALVERAVIHEYNRLLHAAVGRRGTPAWERAYVEIWNYVTPLIRKMTRDDDLARDVAMDVMIKVCEKYDQVRDAGCFLGWAGVIARRAALEAIRAVGREVPLSDMMEQGAGHENAEESAEEYLDRLQETRGKSVPAELNGAVRIAELEARIRACLHRLRHAAEVFIGLVLREVPVSEIARQLGMKANAVYVIFHRARKRLQECAPLLADLGIALEDRR